MDIAVSLVESYLQVNGYFTVTEYPLFEAAKYGATKAVTDVDMLAVRFPREEITKKDRYRVVQGPLAYRTDPNLNCPKNETDMIVAEVKQGKARINAGARNPQVLAAALSRFGCCTSRDASNIVEKLLHTGIARTANDHVVRMVLFASSGEVAPSGWQLIRLDSIIMFMESYFRAHWNELAHVDLQQPALGLFALLQKSQFKLHSHKTS